MAPQLDDEARLKAYFETWLKVIRTAENDLKEAAAALLPMIGTSSRASIFHDLILRRLREAFASQEEIRIARYRRLEVMYLPDGEARVIFKKLAPRSLKSRSYRTPQNRAYLLQQKLGDLPQPAVNYIVGYTMVPLQTHVAHVYATRPNGNSIAWSMCLDEDAKQPALLPAKPGTGPQPTRGRVKPKGAPNNVIQLPERKAYGDA